MGIKGLSNKAQIMGYIAEILLDKRYEIGYELDDHYSEEMKEYYNKVSYCAYWARREAARLKDAQLRRRLKDSRGK